jgi:hypothetical protein
MSFEQDVRTGLILAASVIACKPEVALLKKIR